MKKWSQVKMPISLQPFDCPTLPGLSEVQAIALETAMVHVFFELTGVNAR